MVSTSLMAVPSPTLGSYMKELGLHESKPPLSAATLGFEALQPCLMIPRLPTQDYETHNALGQGVFV